MILTGERTAPGVWHENYWFRRHEAAYAAIPGWVGLLDAHLVLDAGCGEGYAARLLGARWPGARVVGVDYDRDATAHAAATYGDGRTAYLRAAVTALPLPPRVADVTVSMQVLEHIWTPWEYVRELARVTRTQGCVVLSTPNRLTFSPGLGRLEQPPNAYHVREYDADELTHELRHWLPGWDVTLHALRPVGRLAAGPLSHASFVVALQSTPPEDWDEQTARLVRSVTVDDFAPCAPDDHCLDLIAVLRR